MSRPRPPSLAGGLAESGRRQEDGGVKWLAQFLWLTCGAFISGHMRGHFKRAQYNTARCPASLPAEASFSLHSTAWMQSAESRRAEALL